MNKLSGIKRLVSMTVGAGTGIILNGIVEKNVDAEDLNRVGRIQVKASVHVIGAIIGEKTKAYTDKTIDEAAEGIRHIQRVVRVVRDAKANPDASVAEALQKLAEDIRNESDPSVIIEGEVVPDEPTTETK